MWPDQNTHNDQENEGVDFADLRQAFEGNDAALCSPNFTNDIVQSIKREQRRRRFVLAGFGLCGGLIAGSQLSNGLDLVKSFFSPIVSKPTLKTDAFSGVGSSSAIFEGASVSLFLIAALMVGLSVFWVSLSETP